MADQLSKAPHPRRVSAQRDRGVRAGSKARAEGLRAAADSIRMKKSVQVGGRVTGEQSEKLEMLRTAEPELPNRSAAIARAIEVAFAATFDDDVAVAGPDAGEAKEGLQPLSPEAAQIIADALDRWTTSYNELAKQVRAVGHQNNQLVKLGHQAVTHGRDAVIPMEAVAHVGHVVERALDQLLQHAVHDAQIEQVIRKCLLQR